MCVVHARMNSKGLLEQVLRQVWQAPALSNAPITGFSLALAW